MIAPELRDAFAFFRKHAGYATPPGPAACALRLARAELWGKERGVEVTWEEEDERYEDVYGEPPPDDCEILCAFVKHDGEVLAGLGMITIRAPSFTYGVARDPYIRVVNAELLQEARVRLGEIEVAAARAARLAEQKDGALAFVHRLALAFRYPDQGVNGGDLVETVGAFLEKSGVLAEARIAFIEANGYQVTREGDAFVVTGPNDYRREAKSSGDLGAIYAEVFNLTDRGEDEDK